MSPRCMLKIDRSKSYDYLDWGFLESMMLELGFAVLFVRWKMTCVMSVTYSIVLNGKLVKPFSEAKGIR